MWKINGEYTTIMDAKVDYCKSKGWGMNEAALEVFNTITSGVRDGWFFPIRRQKLDEVIFLQWVEELRLVLKPLGLSLSQAFIFAEGQRWSKAKPLLMQSEGYLHAWYPILSSSLLVIVKASVRYLMHTTLHEGQKAECLSRMLMRIQSNEKRRRWSWPLCWAYLIRLSKTKPKVAAKC